VPYHGRSAGYGQVGKSYGNETECIALRRGSARRWQADGVSSNALNPGSHHDRASEKAHGRNEDSGWSGARTSVEQGLRADNQFCWRRSRFLEGVSGALTFEDCNEAPAGLRVVQPDFQRWCLPPLCRSTP